MKKISLLLASLLVVAGGQEDGATCQASNEEVASSEREHANAILEKDPVLAAVSEGAIKNKWGDLLSPAPTAISVLSALLLVTTATDVSLVDAAPQDGWKYVQFPQSLRASTLQVANEAYYALSEAHHNMEKISMKTSHVPTYFRHIARIVASGTKTERRQILPAIVGRLEDVAEKCSELASTTAGAFDSVSFLIDELTMGCSTKEGLSGTKLDAVKASLNVTSASRAEHEKQLGKIEQQAKNAEIAMKDSVKKYQKAIDDAPTAWERFGAALGDAGIAIIKGAVPIIIGKIGNGRRKRATSQVVGDAVKTNIFKTDLNDMFSRSAAPLKLVKLLEEGKAEQATNEARSLKTTLENVHMSLDPTSVPKQVVQDEQALRAQVMEMVNKTIELAKPLSKGTAVDASELQKLKVSAEEWRINVGALQEHLNKETTDTSGMTSQSPEQAKLQGAATGRGAATGDSDSSSLLDAQMDTYRRNIEAQAVLMHAAQKNNDAQRARLDHAMQKASDLMAKVNKLRLDKATIAEIIEVLKDAIEQLTELANAWRHLQQYFKQIAGIVREKHRQTMIDFTDDINLYIENADEDGKFDASGHFMYQSAFAASAENWRVYKMSTTYVRISEKHFMPPLMNISSLLNLDGSTPEGRRQIFDTKHHLESQLDGSQKAIRQLIDEDQKEEDRERSAYMQRLRDDIQSLCGGDNGPEQRVAAEIVSRAGDKPSLMLEYGGFTN